MSASLLSFDLASGAALVALLLGLIATGFLLRFVWPAWRLGHDLNKVLRQLDALPQKEGLPVDVGSIGREIMVRGPLPHLWREYAQTLHGISSVDSLGRSRITAWRATAMAESFFTEQALVDIPLKTEFYKHLPGILTGLGIIGTFAGLIAGLTQFEVSNNAEIVRSSLRALIQGVGHAFKISAAAIALAMILTWIEKSLVAARYRQVARLVQRIDSLFESGVGEEYLARLVRASETSANQGAQIAKMMADELRQALDAMGQRQQEAMARQQEQLAAVVSQAVAQALKEPMNRVAGAIEKTGSGQGEVMNRALEGALARFSEKLDGTFGQRQDGLESLLAQTAVALQQAVGELRRVAQQLESAGRGTVETAASRLDSAGQGIGQASATFTDASREVLKATQTLASATSAASEVLHEHRATRESFARMLGDLRDTVAVARRDAALTIPLVAQLEAAAVSLGQSEQRADAYLQGINKVLGEAHAAFASNVEQTLQQGNSQFQRELATAVDYLRGVVEELGDTLASVTSRP